MKKILIIEDNQGIQMSLTDEFESEGYRVFVAGNGTDGLKLVRDHNPDLIILDIMLPGIDGYEVCRKLRMDRITTHVIMLTVKDKEIDKVLGLELGADDYVTKPFSVRELSARVKTIFRRMNEYSGELGTYHIGETAIDFKKYEAIRRGVKIDFTPLEFQLLHYFVRNMGKVLSRTELLERVWGEHNVVISLRTIDSHIASIRKKLEDDISDPKFIINIRGIGYKLTDL
jgi:two-component system, OmpR family, alkaline phosphatase synthesis response regulator PhoP